MTSPHQRKLVELFGGVKEYLQHEDNFIKDDELKAAFVCVAAVEAAVMFKETLSLAKVCAAWCEATAKDTTERE